MNNGLFKKIVQVNQKKSLKLEKYFRMKLICNRIKSKCNYRLLNVKLKSETLLSVGGLGVAVNYMMEKRVSEVTFKNSFM